MVIELEWVEALSNEWLRNRLRGDLRGEGIWLPRQEGRWTDVTDVLRIELAKPWIRWLVPLLRWNHDGVMRAGACGRVRHLGAALARVRG